MEPLRQTLKVTRIQYQAELTNKRDEMAGNKSKDVTPNDMYVDLDVQESRIPT